MLSARALSLIHILDTIESPLQAGAGALNYHDDFDPDAVQNAGLHMAVAQTVVELSLIHI